MKKPLKKEKKRIEVNKKQNKKQNKKRTSKIQFVSEYIYTLNQQHFFLKLSLSQLNLDFNYSK